MLLYEFYFTLLVLTNYFYPHMMSIPSAATILAHYPSVMNFRLDNINLFMLKNFERREPTIKISVILAIQSTYHQNIIK